MKRSKTQINERSLILFTLLMQAAVGAYLISGGLLLWLAVRQVNPPPAQNFQVLFWLATGLSILGLIASFFHLGSPRNAWYAFANLGSSWLSREVFFALLFSAGVSFFNLLGANSRSGLHMLALYTLTGVFGVALVHSMSRVYRLRTVTGWNTSLTEWYFWTTTFLLGAITTLVGFFISAGLSVDKGMQLPENQLPFLKPLVYGSFIFLLIQIMLSNRLLSQNTQPMAIRADKSRPASMHTILLSLGGLGLLGLLLLIHRTHSNFNLLTALAIISGLCITLGEFFGKIVFYQARRQPGLANPDILWNSNRTILKAYEPLDRGSSHFNKTSD